MSSKNSFVRLCCFIALILAAVLIIIEDFLPFVGVKITGTLPNVLFFIKDIALLLGISFGAFEFCRGKKGLLITFWIAIALYVVSAVFGII